jgi:hypothetical protein
MIRIVHPWFWIWLFSIPDPNCLHPWSLILIIVPFWPLDPGFGMAVKKAPGSCILRHINGTPTKRPVTKRPVTKRPVTKRPVTKGPDYQTSRLPNVQLPKVQITKRPVYQTSSYQTSSYRTSILVIITKHPFFILIIFFNKMCQKYQVCIPI